jgi:hypothetical protein
VTDQTERQPDDNKIQPDKDSIPIDNERTDVPRNQEETHNTGKKPRAPNPGSVLNVLTACLVILAATQAVIYGLTLHQISRQADATDITIADSRRRDSINQQATDSSFALSKQIADHSAILSETIAARQGEYFKIESRAYIVVTLDSLVKPGANSLYFYWTMSNVGKTPAYRVRATVYWWHSQPSIDQQREVSLPTIYMVLGAGIPDSRRATYPTSDSTIILKVFRNEVQTYTTIKIGYEDVFGGKHVSYYHGRHDNSGVIIGKPIPPNN